MFCSCIASDDLKVHIWIWSFQLTESIVFICIQVDRPEPRSTKCNHIVEQWTQTHLVVSCRSHKRIVSACMVTSIASLWLPFHVGLRTGACLDCLQMALTQQITRPTLIPYITRSAIYLATPYPSYIKALLGLCLPVNIIYLIEYITWISDRFDDITLPVGGRAGREMFHAL